MTRPRPRIQPSDLPHLCRRKRSAQVIRLAGLRLKAMGAIGSRYVARANERRAAAVEAELVALQGRSRCTAFQYRPDVSVCRERQVATAAAQFLHAGKSVPKSVGNGWIGRTQHPVDVMMTQAYVAEFCFEAQTLDAALDRYMRCIDIPAQPRRINAIVGAFAQKYFRDNHKSAGTDALPFKNPDDVITFTFHILALIYELSGRGDMFARTKREWITSNDCLNDGEDFSVEFLSGIYDRLSLAFSRCPS